MTMKRDLDTDRLTPIDPVQLTVERDRERRLGDLLRSHGTLGDADIERILALQAERGLRFGAAALALQLVRPDELAQALARQFGYACASVQSHPHLAELAVAVEPHGEQAELLRDLRAQIMLRPGGAAPAAIAVVSPDPGNGRTWVAANLAAAFSQTGERTVLVDANLRTPRLQALFDLPPSCVGLSTLLAETPEQASAVPVEPTRIDVLPSLQVLPVGTPPPNPLELLQRPAFAARLRGLLQRHDRLVVDTPAAHGQADARVIAAACGQALVIGRRHHTRTDRLAALVRDLRERRVDVIGVVLLDRPGGARR